MRCAGILVLGPAAVGLQLLGGHNARTRAQFGLSYGVGLLDRRPRVDIDRAVCLEGHLPKGPGPVVLDAEFVDQQVDRAKDRRRRFRAREALSLDAAVRSRDLQRRVHGHGASRQGVCVNPGPERVQATLEVRRIGRLRDCLPLQGLDLSAESRVEVVPFARVLRGAQGDPEDSGHADS